MPPLPQLQSIQLASFNTLIDTALAHSTQGLTDRCIQGRCPPPSPHIQGEMPEPDTAIQAASAQCDAAVDAQHNDAAVLGNGQVPVTAGEAVAQVQVLPSMLEKLASSEQQRKAKQEQRRQEAQQLVNPQENVQATIKSLLEAAQASHASGNSDAVQTGLDTASNSLLELEQRLADSSYYLPSWDLKACTSQLQDAKTRLESARATLVPKKRFAFSSKKVARVKATDLPATGEAAAGVAATDAQAPATDATLASSSASQQQPAAAAGPSAQDVALVAAGQGIADVHDQVIIRTASQLSGQDYVIMNCTGCTIYLLGYMGALRLLHLRNCTVCTGPVPGATFVDDVNTCTLVLASYQVRVHRAVHTDLYLRVRSRPIIEHSHDVRVAPYNLQDDTVQGLLAQYKLGDETDMWRCVDDFGWIKAIQSPNWSVLPQEERRPAIVVNPDTLLTTTTS